MSFKFHELIGVRSSLDSCQVPSSLSSCFEVVGSIPAFFLQAHERFLLSLLRIGGKNLLEFCLLAQVKSCSYLARFLSYEGPNFASLFL